jgi:hypothetical protein
MASNNNLVPCEVCGEMVLVDDYATHVAHCSHRSTAVPISMFINNNHHRRSMSTVVSIAPNSFPHHETSDEDDHYDDRHEDDEYEDRIVGNHQIGSGASINSFYMHHFGRHFSRSSAQRANVQLAAAQTPNMIDYDANIELAERIGNVEIGVKNIRILGEIVNKVSLLDTDICPICQEQMFHLGDIRRMKCSHLFCDECITKWLSKNKKCPICKYEFS